MQIKDRLAASPKAAPFTVKSEQMVTDAVAGMAEHNFGSAIVVDDDNKVIGILTERDIVKRLVNAGRSAGETPVSAIMTAEPRVARESDELEHWMREMTQGRFRRVPIVDEAGRVTSVLTQTDMVAYAWPVMMSQAKDLADREARRNTVLLMIGGGILVYAIAMVVVVDLIML